MKAADCHASPPPFRFVRSSVLACLLLLTGQQAATAQAIYEPTLPESTLGDATGYFPTLVESPLLRGAADSRSLGIPVSPDSEDGPDRRMQTATDIFPYYDPEPNFYQRHPGLFRPLDHFFGLFTPFDAATVENDRLQNASVTLDARLGVVTRSFAPELATIKAGPLFFDLLWVGAGVIYSDFNGPAAFLNNADDGWTGYVELAMRAYLRLTDTIYISAAASLIYLPFENELGLRFGNGNSDSLFARINYSDTIGGWDILVFDEFRGSPGFSFYGPAENPAIDRAGRYYFGFQQTRANEFFNEDFTFFANRIGINLNRLVFDNQWRFAITADHTDFWRTFSFDDHRYRDHAGLWLGYEGSVIPFAPRFLYDIYSFDGYDSAFHRFALHLTGRITENINWIGQVGYLMTTGTRPDDDRVIWQLGFDHAITRNTLHWLRFGEDFFVNELLPETLTTRFIQWGIDQRITKELYLRGFVQYSEGETIMPSLRLRDRIGAGLTIGFQPLDFTHIRGIVLYEQVDQAFPQDEGDRWLYRLEVTQQLGLRLTGNAFYQYEENSISRAFSEHVLGLSLRRFF